MGSMKKKYPIGIQTFSRIIREGLVYVDKTDLVWQLAHYATFIFLSRPRRFGKSLLTTTLASYFSGERELFEGLKIMQLEKEWQQYPVIRLDLSMAKNQATPDNLRARLMLMLEDYAEEMFKRIKARYDGYHFSEKSEDIYNPYSLLNAFPYQTDGRSVAKVGVKINPDTRIPEDWVIL